MAIHVFFADQCKNKFYRRVNQFKFEGWGGDK
jgi:hypothetical protein